MPSRAEMRVWIEHMLRVIVLLAVTVMLWQSLRESAAAGRQIISAGGLDVRKLTEWSATPAAHVIQVQLDRVPPAIERAWLAALNGAASVTWRGEVPFLMIAAQPIVSPTGGTNVVVAAPRRSPVAVSVDGLVTDTVSAPHGGASLTLGTSARHVTAGVSGSFASTAQRDSVMLRKILVIGRVGWESKFVVAALEEVGWNVDARVRIAPGIEATQGSTAMIDTSRYSAVIGLDEAVLPYANRIMQFARTGGGVLLGSRAAGLDALAGLRAGTTGRAVPESRAVLPTGPVTLASLPLAPITSVRSDAVPLDRRSGALAIAARRLDAGRALQVGYADTWRWRMSGADPAVRDHRQWWTDLVSSVAYAPRVPRRVTVGLTDQAPTIGLVAAIGPATPRGHGPGLTGAAWSWMPWLMVLLALGLIAEVASRRLRGTS